MTVITSVAAAGEDAVAVPRRDGTLPPRAHPCLGALPAGTATRTEPVITIRPVAAHHRRRTVASPVVQGPRRRTVPPQRAFRQGGPPQRMIKSERAAHTRQDGSRVTSSSGGAMEMHFATVWESIADAIADAHGGRPRRRRAARGASTTTGRPAWPPRSRRPGSGPTPRSGCYLYNGNEYLEAQYGGFKMRGVPDQRQLPLPRRRARGTCSTTPTPRRSCSTPRLGDRVARVRRPAARR